ncbi:hypothetical protein [Candidatus Magnetominusculus xianensis]|uniref:Uncharacterized protein n=1 Tax=Candidatus Magnetominusculus xianensis TaxID=1748249 RepID=A0ABR5SF48_9BACT|nr:hypothetical protein [Candidatus Magnetominusculus xianensis]KWT85470.1 hypothetical protein ASN18_1722 [Candidatus Magnetominusculus xianensis]
MRCIDSPERLRVVIERFRPAKHIDLSTLPKDSFLTIVERHRHGLKTRTTADEKEKG